MLPAGRVTNSIGGQNTHRQPHIHLHVRKARSEANLRAKRVVYNTNKWAAAVFGAQNAVRNFDTQSSHI